VTEDQSDRGYTPAKQARSRRTEQKFLEAAEVIFAQNGFARARIADIVSVSGCSTGSFYHRFSDKRDLFDVMLDRIWTELVEETGQMDLSRQTHGSLANLLTHYAGHSLDTVRGHEGFYRAVQEISVVDPTAWNKLKGLTVRIGERFAAEVEQYADEIPQEDKQQAIKHAIQVIVLMAVHTTLGSGPLFPSDQSQLRDVMVKAALGVLR